MEYASYSPADILFMLRSSNHQHSQTSNKETVTVLTAGFVANIWFRAGFHDNSGNMIVQLNKSGDKETKIWEAVLKQKLDFTTWL